MSDWSRPCAGPSEEDLDRGRRELRARDPHASFVARVAAIVARYTLDGPLPTWFEVTGDELETAAIVRARMGRIQSRVPIRGDGAEFTPIMTTAREVIPIGCDDAEVERRFHAFALGLYEHEFHEWFKRDGVLVDDPHAEAGP